MTIKTTDVAIIMGSDSDLPVVEAAFPILESFGINYTKNVLSAHRTPHAVIDFINKSELNGCKVFIAAAGMAAHLAGALAAHTTKPVIGIPIESGGMGGMDSLLSTVMMPPGVPVATVALNGAKNAGILAAQILGITDKEVLQTIVEYKESLKTKVIDSAKNIN